MIIKADTLRVIAVMGFIIYIWLIIAVELTLKWNAVEGVYMVNSTGQVIPLVVGIGIMLNIFWKLIRHEKVSANATAFVSFFLERLTSQGTDFG